MWKIWFNIFKLFPVTKAGMKKCKLFRYFSPICFQFEVLFLKTSSEFISLESKRRERTLDRRFLVVLELVKNKTISCLVILRLVLLLTFVPAFEVVLCSYVLVLLIKKFCYVTLLYKSTCLTLMIPRVRSQQGHKTFFLYKFLNLPMIWWLEFKRQIMDDEHDS